MTTAMQVQELSDGYIRLLSESGESLDIIRDREKALLSCIKNFDGASLPATGKFMYGYIAVLNGDFHGIAQSAGLEILEQAHKDGDLNATVFLSEIYASSAAILPDKMKKPLRAAVMQDQAAAKGNVYANFLVARRLADKPDLPDHERSDVEGKALRIMNDLLERDYCGGHYLAAIWGLDGGPGPASPVVAAASLEKTIAAWDKMDFLMSPTISDAKYRLAKICNEGRYVERDRPRAELLMREAARTGHKEALAWLRDSGLADDFPKDGGYTSPMRFFHRQSQERQSRRQPEERQARQGGRTRR